jgi:hypothetical protein
MKLTKMFSPLSQKPYILPLPSDVQTVSKHGQSNEQQHWLSQPHSQSYHKFKQSHILKTSPEKISVLAISVPDATPNP